MSLDLKQKISATFSNHGVEIGKKMVNAIYDLVLDISPDFRYAKNRKPEGWDNLPNKIDKVVTEYFDVTIKQLYGKTRKQPVRDCRHVCMYLNRVISKMTLKEIGKRYGGRDHTTVIHSNNAVKDLMETDERFKSLVLDLHEEVIGLKLNNLSIAS